MTDYPAVLLRAVSTLPHNDARSRQELYARARAIVTEHLRARGRQASAQTMREQVELETAIRDVEAQYAAEPQADATAHSLAKILQALQAEDLPARPLTKAIKTEASQTKDSAAPGLKTKGSRAESSRAEGSRAEGSRPEDFASEDFSTEQMDNAPHSLGTMLFVVAYVAAALAFTGVTYIRTMVWMYEGDIGYPILIAVMATTLLLFIVPPLVMLRKAPSQPTAAPLLRFIYSASRRVF